MYETHFGLTGSPFQLNPDPAFYFDSRGHAHALSYLKYGAHQGEGFIVVTGEIGAGKTTVVRTLLAGLDASRVVAAQIVSTQLEPGELLRAILNAYGVPVMKDGKDAKANVIATLEAFLTSLAAQGKRALLIIDEAQNLNRESVEELRMLSNFQLGNHALLQSFLVGQPELRELLKSKAMEQLRQRVIASCHLKPLDMAETRSYILHRLRHVGWQGSPHFSDAAFARIHEWTDGVPRRINRLCNRLMLAAYLAGADAVTEQLVIDTATELRAEIGEAVADDAAAANDAHAEDAADPAFDIAPRTVSSASSLHTGRASRPAVEEARLANAGRPRPQQAGPAVDFPLMTRSLDMVPVAPRHLRPRLGASARRGSLLCVCDTRAGFWKFAALAQTLGSWPDLPPLTLVHTGSVAELSSGEVSKQIMPVSYSVVHLGLDGADYAQTSSAVNDRFDALLAETGSTAMLSLGTSDAVLLCTLLAKKRGLGIFRADAGQRDGEVAQGGENNAVLLDRLADELQTAMAPNVDTLCQEGVASAHVHCIGSLLTNFIARLRPELPDEAHALASYGLRADAVRGGYAVLSYALPVGAAMIKAIGQVLPVLRAVANEVHVVWPLRPGQFSAAESAGLNSQLAKVGVFVVEDKGYVQSLGLLRHALCLINGAERELGEEALVLGKPSITTGGRVVPAAATHERANLMVGFNVEQAVQAVRTVRASDGAEIDTPELWDGAAGDRLAEHLSRWMGRKPKTLSLGLESA